MWYFSRRRTSSANSRSENATDEPYRPKNHYVFKPIGALGPTFISIARIGFFFGYETRKTVGKE